ncbi:tRNA lysidine(34) synthetase TilS [Flavobacterium okayamense]|uniref:tRNA(Ile)-lysidine synthase n=1 Tax=Flavobacterium okayamense TaxID=2830782 RepID=A0ABN6HX99_9FLAO|nr:tRNA lysidine(34) synthetase TilS [Flavobacterium okayamense]BCY29024.1 tRNA(Ile)-lysidine synthase [Flavobacterium okayamense]
MLQQFQNHIQTQFPFLKENKFFIAVSGGIDSMVLVDLFRKLSYNFSILHCNFQLRGEESEAETQFLRDFCKANQIHYILRYFDTNEYAEEHKLSTQLAARKLRYNWFKQKLGKNNFQFLLTAHHADDNLETFIINLSRGTGLEGLTGIPIQNDYIIRPLLPFSRDEILAYAEENKLSWKEDSSNASEKYLRNKIRHQIVPILKELHPTFLANFQKTQEFLNESQNFIETEVNNKFEEIVEEFSDRKVIYLEKLLQLQNWQTYLYHWLKPYGFSAWNDIFELVKSSSGKQIFSDDYILLKDRKTLILHKNGTTSEVYYFTKDEKSLKVPLKITKSKVDNIFNPTKDVIFVDEDKLSFPLIIKKWDEGEYFYPSGMLGKKKLSKFYKDEKLSLFDKENQWILYSNNEIVWVIGKRADQRFLANETTQNIIKIELEE